MYINVRTYGYACRFTDLNDFRRSVGRSGVVYGLQVVARCRRITLSDYGNPATLRRTPFAIFTCRIATLVCTTTRQTRAQSDAPWAGTGEEATGDSFDVCRRVLKRRPHNTRIPRSFYKRKNNNNNNNNSKTDKQK